MVPSLTSQVLELSDVIIHIFPLHLDSFLQEGLCVLLFQRIGEISSEGPFDGGP